MPKLRLCVILVVGISLLLFFPGLVFVILHTYHIQCGKWIILKGKNIGISLDVGLQHESKGISPNESDSSFEYSNHQLERKNIDHTGRKIKQRGKNSSSKQNLGSKDQYDDILEIFEKATNAMQGGRTFAPPSDTERVELVAAMKAIWEKNHTSISLENPTPAERAASGRLIVDKDQKSPIIPERITFSKRYELGKILEGKGFKVGVEIGVQKGIFAEKTLGSWLSVRTYVLVDAWANQKNYKDLANLDGKGQESNYVATQKRMAPFRARGVNIITCRNYSTVCVHNFNDHYFDYIYVDARHDFKGVYQDLVDWWPKLKPGGLFAGHDFVTQDEGPRQTGQDWTLNYDGTIDHTRTVVKGAVKRFAMENNLVISQGQEAFPSWAIIKPESAYGAPSSTIVMEKEGILMTVFDYSAQNNQNIPYTRVVHRLLQSVRLHNPGVRVALATNNKNQNWDAFDIVFTPAEWQNNTTEISSKIAGLKNSPFERTIFLDSETVVMGSLLPLFEFLRWYDLAMAPQNNWKGNWYLEQVLCGGSTASLEVQYNTGVFAYRQSPSTRKFFDIWNTIHHNSPCNRKVLSNGKQNGAFDQCSLHHAIRKTDGLKVATLDADIWNDRRIIPHSEPTRVAHPHCTDTRGTGCDDFWKHPDYAHKPQAPIQTTYSEEYCRKI